LYSVRTDCQSRADRPGREREATAAAIVGAGRERRHAGHAATTLREIAAQCVVQTVYAVFGSKANILRELRDGVASDPRSSRAFQAAMAATTADELAHSPLDPAPLGGGWDVTAIHTRPRRRRCDRDGVDAVLAPWRASASWPPRWSG
jgi:AcrR family transcriptional regulator